MTAYAKTDHNYVKKYFWVCNINLERKAAIVTEIWQFFYTDPDLLCNPNRKFLYALDAVVVLQLARTLL